MTEQLSNEISQVYAIGRLYEFCSSKRFHLIKNEFISDSVGIKALEINNQIKINSGIDLFEATKANDLLQYEKILNEYTSRITNQIIPLEELGDEIELLKDQISFPNERMAAFNFTLSEQIKPYLKSVHLTIPDLMGACKYPDYVVYFEDSFSFFMTKKIKIGAKYRIIFIHATFENPENATTPILASKDPHQIRIFSAGGINTSQLGNKLQMRMIIVLSYDKFDQLINDPTRLFIKCLDLYGVRIQIGETIKKFYKNKILPAHMTSLTDVYKVLHDNTGHIRAVSMVKKSRIANTLIFLYAVNFVSLSKDLLMGKT